MSALGHKRTFASAKRHVRFTSNSGHVRCNSICPLCANSGHCANYPTTASGRASRRGSTPIPSALTAVRLMTISNLVGCVAREKALCKHSYDLC